MKVKNNVTVYQCDFCNKKLFRKNAMVNHEIKCSKNPKNIRACFDCVHCEVVNILFESDVQTYNDDDDTLIESKTFKCNKKNIFMFPPKLEYRENGVPSYVEYKGDEIMQEKMPLICEVKDSQTELFKIIFNWE